MTDNDTLLYAHADDLPPTPATPAQEEADAWPLNVLAVAVPLLAPVAIHYAVTDRLLLRGLCLGGVVLALLAAAVCYSACVVGGRADRQ